MKFVKWFISSLIIIILSLFIASLFLPDKYYLQRSITINTSDTNVYKYLISLKNIRNYSPWHKLDTGVKYSYSGIDAVENSSVNWVSEKDNLTGAEMKIKKLIPNKLIDMYFTFSKQGDFDLKYKIQTINKGFSKLSIELNKDIGYNFPFRYYALMYNYHLIPDFDSALKNIKMQCENLH